jgi:hypothetical protein
MRDVAQNADTDNEILPRDSSDDAPLTRDAEIILTGEREVVNLSRRLSHRQSVNCAGGRFRRPRALFVVVACSHCSFRLA